MATIELKHSIDAAHRVVGHEGGKGKCARLHGHTYSVVVRVTCLPQYYTTEGFVVDFAVLKDIINQWDHRTVLWEQDPLVVLEDSVSTCHDHVGVVRVPFNPTSENMSQYLAELIQVEMFARVPHGKIEVVISETPKSNAKAEIAW
jgi:6-pyruvoyltetrahydropterin/6-carboxytetrahydropterin synthase